MGTYQNTAPLDILKHQIQGSVCKLLMFNLQIQACRSRRLRGLVFCALKFDLVLLFD